MTRTLAARIALVVVVVAGITAAVAGVLALELTRQAYSSSAHRELADLADEAETRADRGDQRAALLRVKRLLRTLDVEFTPVNGRGRALSPGPLTSGALTPDDVATLLGGQEVSAQREVDGQQVFLEARPTDRGAVVLVQAREEALAAGEKAFRRTLLALLVGVVVAIPASIVLAGALARPLRRTADAAHALAEGHRDVRVPVEGPVEVAEVAASLNTLAESLEHSEGRQRSFLLSVSHDLRTPLTAVRGYAESLADGTYDGDPREAGRVMTVEAQRLERLIADLLSLARLEADSYRVDLAETDLASVVTATGLAWQEPCHRAGVRLEVVSGARAVVATDAGRLRQVLDALLENALRVTPVGEPLVLESRTEPGQVLLEVRDGGPGLTADDVADAFRPGVLYERYRGVRPSGTGLGLAIVDGIVRRLGGTVEAGQAREGGARFTVRLPTP